MIGIKVRPLMTSYLKDLEIKEQNGLLRKMLPFLLIASFMWLCLYESFSDTAYNMFITSSAFKSSLFVDLIFSGIVNWLIFEVTFYVYKLVLSFSVFSYTIPKMYMNNRARLFMVFRNIALGIILNICFFVPALSAFEPLIVLVVDFVVFALLVKHMLKDRVHITVTSNVYKALFTPFIILKAVEMLFLMLEVL